MPPASRRPPLSSRAASLAPPASRRPPRAAPAYSMAQPILLCPTVGPCSKCVLLWGPIRRAARVRTISSSILFSLSCRDTLRVPRATGPPLCVVPGIHTTVSVCPTHFAVRSLSSCGATCSVAFFFCLAVARCLRSAPACSCFFLSGPCPCCPFAPVATDQPLVAWATLKNALGVRLCSPMSQQLLLGLRWPSPRCSPPRCAAFCPVPCSIRSSPSRNGPRVEPFHLISRHLRKL